MHFSLKENKEKVATRLVGGWDWRRERERKGHGWKKTKKEKKRESVGLVGLGLTG